MGRHCHTEGHLPRLQQKEALVSSGRLFSLSVPQFPPLFETLPFETTKLNLHPHQFCVLSEAQDMLLKISVHKNNTQFSFLVKFTVWEGEGIDGK